MEEDSIKEEQPDVIETADRLKAVCVWENDLLGPWEAKMCA